MSMQCMPVCICIFMHVCSTQVHKLCMCVHVWVCRHLWVLAHICTNVFHTFVGILYILVSYLCAHAVTRMYEHSSNYILASAFPRAPQHLFTLLSRATHWYKPLVFFQGCWAVCPSSTRTQCAAQWEFLPFSICIETGSTLQQPKSLYSCIHMIKVCCCFGTLRGYSEACSWSWPSLPHAYAHGLWSLVVYVCSKHVFYLMTAAIPSILMSIHVEYSMYLGFPQADVTKRQ